MILPRAELIAKLSARGIPTASMSLFAPDEVEGLKFGTFSAEFIHRAWDGFIALLRSDPNARLTMPRAIGRSGATVEVPRYIDPGFVCRHATFAFFGYLLICVGKQAGASEAAGVPQENDAYGFSPVYYTATPRAENGNRSGRHCRIFYFNPLGEIEEFEEGDGDPEPMTAEEFATVSFNVFV